MWKEMIPGLLPMVLEKATPEIRELLEGFVNMLKEKARKTENPFDDAGVALLAAALGLKHKG